MTEKKYKKKLIEVALPLEEINKISKTKGYHTKIHLWWARRPLSTCQAVILASLIDDPGNYLPLKQANNERKKLYKKIINFITKNDSRSKKEIQNILNKSTNGNLPKLFDPFSGGGTIPLAGQIIGLESYGNDLNPIAVLISKCLIEFPYKLLNMGPINHASHNNELKKKWNKLEGFIEDLIYYGKYLNNLVRNDIIKYYPSIDGNNNKEIIGWLWARTVKCPNPACNVYTPLIKNWNLSTKKGNPYSLFPTINKKMKVIDFGVQNKESELKSTIGRTGGICVSCGATLSLKYIRSEGKSNRIKNKLTSMVINNGKNKYFIEPDKSQSTILKKININWIPETEIPFNPQYLPTPNYGMKKFSDLFTIRQKLLITTFVDNLNKIEKKLKDDFNNLNDSKISNIDDYSRLIITYLALAINKLAENNNSLCRWRPDHQRYEGLFARQAIPMVWDFAENNPFQKDNNQFNKYVANISDTLKQLPAIKGEVYNYNSSVKFGINEKDILISTDPPYYDNIGYSDLSDFFYIWLRKSLSRFYPDLFATLNTPKNEELVANKYRFKGDKKLAEDHFYNGMLNTFSLIYDHQDPEFPLTIHYAFKQAEKSRNEEDLIFSTGWDTFLSGILDSKFQIVGTWPIRTETGGRMRSIGSNALASSIVIVCRKRDESAPISTRREFIKQLKKELPPALKNLQEAGIAPVDMAQSAIGPGMAVFSRYSKVLEADGNEMSVRTALQIINQELDGFLTEQESDMDKETRFCIAWYEQFGWKEGPFGDANTLANAKGSAVNALESAEVTIAKAGKVRLLKRSELKETWDPTKDKKLTVWECVQHLIKILEEKGEDKASEIFRKLGGLSDSVKELTYRLYSLSEKKRWTEDGIAYNSLISSWQSISDKAIFLDKVSEETKKNIKEKSQRKLGEWK